MSAKMLNSVIILLVDVFSAETGVNRPATGVIWEDMLVASIVIESAVESYVAGFFYCSTHNDDLFSP